MHASRLVYADQLKCLAIVLVVLGHVLGQMGLGASPFLSFIGKFHTMLFMFLSGYFAFKPESDIANAMDVWRYLLKKVRRVFVPFLIIGCFYSWLAWKDVMPVLLGTTDAYWFLPALFGCMVLAMFYHAIVMTRVGFKINVLLGIVTCIVLLGLWHLGITKPIPYSFMIAQSFPFFLFGCFYRRFEQIRIFCASDWLYGICFIGTIILLFNPLKVNLIGFFIIIMLLRLFQSNSSKLPRIMSYMGRHTMEIYLLHFFFLPNDFKYIASVISPNGGAKPIS